MKLTLTLIVALALVVAVSAQAATSYTDAQAFRQAVESYGFSLSVGFDGQAPGSSATNYGMLTINAEGLLSDGSTFTTLVPVATDTYPAVSAANSVGDQLASEQFLAGNSDRITFTFSSPVYAFGVYLIGNPSPTGEPAIPFWKMRVVDASGFEAYSSTDPIDSLDTGSDLYFLGVIQDEPFLRVELLSDNDPAAVFSYCIDDVMLATKAEKASIREAKHLSEGSVVVEGLAVTRAHSDRFNIETSDRTMGIAVIGQGPTRGEEISLLASVESTSDDERVLRLIHLISSRSGTPAETLYTGARALGGGVAVGYQPGCLESYGPNNIGLDVTISGRVTAVDGSHTWMTIDDGTNRDSRMGSTGVMVTGEFWGSGVSVGEFLRVTGSCSLIKLEGEHFPLVRVASPLDVSPLL